MRAVIAIAMHSIKAAVRSRLFAMATLVLIACMTALPFLVKGDGTAVGEARVLIYYNIMIAAILIGILSLVQSCGAVAQEIAERQIQLIRSKPVSAAHIWFGKWLGILAVNMVLVIIAAVVTRSAVAARGLSGVDVRNEILTARRQLVPEGTSIEQEVDHRFHVLRDEGRLAENAVESEVKQQIRLRIVAERTTVAAGEERRWTFRVPAVSRPADGGLVEIKSRFNSAVRDEKPMLCSWRILDAKGEELFSVAAKEYYDGLNGIAVPPELIREQSSLTLVFRNEEAVSGRTLVFDQKRGVEILVSEGGFGMNMFKAGLMIFVITSLLAAVGLSLGSMLSFPVAVFASAAILTAAVTAHFFNTTEIAPHSHGNGHSDCSGCDETDKEFSPGAGLAEVVDRIVAPVFNARPAELLSEGILITWMSVWNAVKLMLILYPGLLFAGSAFMLSRRQLALPEMIS